jgi:hypothetical protein
MGMFTVIPQDAFDALQMDAAFCLRLLIPHPPPLPQMKTLSVLRLAALTRLVFLLTPTLARMLITSPTI